MAEWALDRERLAIRDLRAANPEEDGFQGKEEAELYGLGGNETQIRRPSRRKKPRNGSF